MSLAALLLALLPAGDAVVRVEIYGPARQRFGDAQDWARRFAEEDVRITVGVQRPGLDYGVFEKARGPLRFVTVRAELTADGALRLPDRTLKPGDGRTFKAWLDGLKVYGAAGNPAGQPGWGLSATDWIPLCRDAAKLGDPLPDATVGTVLERLATVTGREVRRDDAVDTSAACQPPPASVSVGVGTAIALRSVELGLTPSRTPSGDVVWSVGPLADEAAAWPAGWTMTPDANRGRAFPTLYDEGELPRTATLRDYLPRMQTMTGVPHVPLRRDLAEWKPEWEAVDTSVQPPKGRPVIVLNRMLRRNRLTTRTVWDDGGRAFLLIRPSNGQVDPPPRELRPPAVAAVDPVSSD